MTVEKYLSICDEFVKIYHTLEDSDIELSSAIKSSKLKEIGINSQFSQIEYTLSDASKIQISRKLEGKFVWSYLEIDQFEDVEKLPEDVYQALKSKYVGLHESIYWQLKSYLGSPNFTGNYGDEGYPKDLTSAYVLTYWQRNVAYLSCETTVGDYSDRFALTLYVGIL